MLARSLVVLCAASVLVASPARADDPGRDVASGSYGTGTLTLGPLTATLWSAPFQQTLYPELTLTLRPVLGLEPVFSARTALPLLPGSGIGSDFGFRYRAGRFHAGARFSFVNQSAGLALDTFAYARYVAPKYHLGLSDNALLPLASNLAPTHRLAASAAFKPSTDALSLHVSSSIRDSGTEPHLTAGLFGKF